MYVCVIIPSITSTTFISIIITITITILPPLRNMARTSSWWSWEVRSFPCAPFTLKE
jgi:hypothetical protein